MRNLVFLLLLLSFSLKAQIPQNAPWMISNDTVSRANEWTYDQMVAKAQTYFNSIDIDKKGSGYKPFKRWEY
ncbi:MAG: hypothetical protein IT220_09700, partial [Flavobacteriaceae bacterium]|nr:hypothetical protein [Flavobacteriaceae bacterium]